MKLFIQIKDGQPFEHPIVHDNFCQAFPAIDTVNLPLGFVQFERIEKPNTCGIFEVEDCFYQWVGGVVKDVWVVRAMTNEETVAKQAEMDENIANAKRDLAEYMIIFNKIPGSVPSVIG